MPSKVNLNLTPMRLEQVAQVHGRNVSDKFKADLQADFDKMIKTYTDADFFAEWPAKRLATACALFRSVLKSDNLRTPSRRVLREILANANDYEVVLKPLVKQVLKFISIKTEYSKIRHEINLYAKLTSSERLARKMYVGFIFSVIKQVKGPQHIKKMQQSFTDDPNSTLMWGLANKICAGTEQKSTPAATRIWLIKNLKFLASMWETDFKEFKD